MPDSITGLEPDGSIPAGTDEFVAEFLERRSRGIQGCEDAWARAEKNHRFLAPGESQWPADVRKEAEESGGATLSFDEIRPIVHHLSGRQTMSRFQRTWVPRSTEAARWGEIVTEVDRAMMEGTNGSHEESCAFRNGPCIGALGWLKCSLDSLDDPDGRFKLEEVPLWSMIWPADEARKTNLRDRDWHIHGRWYSRKAFIAEYGQAAYDRVKRFAGLSWQDQKMGKSSVVAWRGQYGHEERMGSLYDRSDSLWVEHYECREVVVKYRVAVPADPNLTHDDIEALVESGELIDREAYVEEVLSPDKFAAYKAAYKDQHGEDLPRLAWVKQPGYEYMYGKFVGTEEIERGSIRPAFFTYLALSGVPWEKPDGVEWRAVVDSLRDAQHWKNVFLSVLVRFMQVNPKGTLIVEKGVFRSLNDAAAKWAGGGSILEVNRGTLQGSANKPYVWETGSSSPQGGFIEGMLHYADAAIPRLAGFNAGALGQLGPDLRRISGEVVQAVRDAAVASHAHLFDGFSLHQQDLGKVIMGFIAEFFSDPEHLARVVGEDKLYREVEDPDTGQKVRELVMPPKEMWSEAAWRLSVQESAPAPDRTRATWEALTASGGLQLMVQQGAFGVRDLVELAPDLPPGWRERKLKELELAGEGQQGAEQGMAVISQVLAEMVQYMAEMPDERKQAIISALSGGEQEPAAMAA